jgi:hypothetical protein
MSYETGLAMDTLEAAMQQLQAEGLCQYDATQEIVWVVDLLRNCGLTPQKHGKITLAIQRQVQHLRQSPLSKSFAKTYRSWLTASAEPQPRLSRASGEAQARLQLKDQDQDQVEDLVRGKIGGAGGRREVSTMNGARPRHKHCGYGTCTDPLAEWSSNFCEAHAPQAAEETKQRQLTDAAKQGLLP